MTEKGYQLEDDFLMSRFVGLASEDRKNEIIIFYIEMAKGNTGYTLEEIENTLNEKEVKTIRDGLILRSKNSFHILKG